jgi:hypothetical protein
MNTDPQRPLTPEEERKVKRSLTILYVAMGLLAAAPFIVLWWVNRAK